MSEFQYYEFQALDRRLTAQEMEELHTFSSRAKITSTSASFVYHYGNFRGEPEKVLEKYFDMMLYMANWGSRRLLLRFPKALVNIPTLEAYCGPDAIEVTEHGKYVILDLNIYDESGGGGRWLTEEEGDLTPLMPLRQAIIDGDYRVLYLAWLRACELEFSEGGADDGAADDEEDEEDADDENSGSDYSYFKPNTPEPPVPPNLGQLNGALAAYSEFIELDPIWIAAAAQASATVADKKVPLEQWVAMLPEADAKKLLLRAVQGEPNIAATIKSELQTRFAESPLPQDAGPRRTVEQLAAAVRKEKQRTADEKRRKEERARMLRLETLAKRQEEAWQQAVAAIESRKGYEDAVKQLAELKELAEYRHELAAFQPRMEQLAARFTRLSSLRRMLLDARLIKP